MASSGRLKGKVALITGTGGGQGRAAAILFAREGAKVVGCDLKTEGARETVELVRAAGGEMVSMQPLDLSKEQEAKRWIDFGVETYGGFDILYNNASAARFGPPDSMSLEDWEFTLRNELTLVFLTVKHAIPVLRRRGGGSIVNIASVVGLTGNPAVPGGAAHAATKAGVIVMSGQWAGELGPYKIRVNTIAPGAIDTPAIAAALSNPEAREHFTRQAALNRLGAPEDVAYAALYLASDESSFVTGACISVDGGSRQRLPLTFLNFDTTGFNVPDRAP